MSVEKLIEKMIGTPMEIGITPREAGRRARRWSWNMSENELIENRPEWDAGWLEEDLNIRRTQ